MFNLVFWPRVTAATYNYGSVLTFHQTGAVTFSNQLMPPGTPIRSWESLLDPKRHLEVSLPLLEPGVEYYWEGVFSNLDGHLQTQVLFEDDAGQEVDRTILDENRGTFIFPEDARGYRINLVNIHHERFTFDYGVLTTAAIARTHNWQVDLSQQQLYVYPEEAGQTIDPESTQITPRDDLATSLSLIARNTATKFLMLPAHGALCGIYGTEQQFRTTAWVTAQEAQIRAHAFSQVLNIDAFGPATFELAQALADLNSPHAQRTNV